MRFRGVLGGVGRPIFLIGVWTTLALHRCNRGIHFATDCLPPLIDLAGFSPTTADEILLSYLEAIASERRLFQFGVDVEARVMFSMAAEAQEASDDHLRTATATCFLYSCGDNFQAI